MKKNAIGTMYIGAQATQNSAEGIVKKESTFDGIEFYLYVIGGDAGLSVVTHEMLKQTGMTESEAWNQAERNTKEQTTMQSLSEIIGLPEDETGVYVLSNHAVFGAGSLAVQNIIKDFATAHHTHSVAMLPSSIFEVLLLPNADVIPEEELSQMVRDVNAQEIPDKKERLGNRAYVLHF